MLDDATEVEEMKILIEESVLRQALEAMEEGKYNTRTAQAYDEALTAGRTALDSAETVESFYRAAYNKAIEDAAKVANEAYCTNHVLISIRALEMK